jgi:hypothetical protein
MSKNDKYPTKRDTEGRHRMRGLSEPDKKNFDDPPSK